MLGFERFGEPGHVLVDALTNRGQVVRMHVLVDPFLCRDGFSFVRVAQQLAQTGDEQRVVAHVPVPELVTRSPQRKAQTILALAQVVTMPLKLRATPVPPAPQQRADGEESEQIEQLRLVAGPPRRRHQKTERCDRFVPITVVIGRAHIEVIASRVEIRVGRFVPRAGIDPALVEAFEPILEPVALGRGKIERREFEMHDAIALRHAHVVRAAQHAAIGVADDDIGEHHRRRKTARDNRLRREQRESVDAAECEPPVAQRRVGAVVEFGDLQTVRRIECAEFAGASIERGQALVRAEPEASHGVFADGTDRSAWQSIARQPAREAHALAVGAVEAVESELRADPDRAVGAFVDRAYDVARERARIGRILAIHMHRAGLVDHVQAVQRADPDVAGAVLMQSEHRIAAEPRRAGVRAQHLPAIDRRVISREAVERGAEPEPAIVRGQHAAHVGVDESRVFVVVERQHGRGAARRIEQRNTKIRRDPQAALSGGSERRHAEIRQLDRRHRLRVAAARGHGDAQIRMLRRRRGERARDHIAVAVECVRGRIVALESVFVGADPEAAARIFENRVHVVGGDRIVRGILIDDRLEDRSGRIHAREPALARRDPEQPGSIDQEIRDQCGGKRSGQIAFGFDPDLIAVFRIEADESFVRHGEPEPSARIFGERGNGMRPLRRPHPPRRAALVEAIKAVVTSHIKAMRVIDEQCGDIVEHIRADAFDGFRLRGQLEQSERARDPQRAVITATQLMYARGASFVVRQRRRGFDALAMCIDVCETRIGADPQTVPGIDRKRTHRQVIGECAGRVRHAFDRASRCVEPRDVATGTDPDHAIRIFGQRRHRAFFGGGIIGGLLERAERVAVVTLQTRLRSDPEKPGVVLHDRVDRILGEALIAADGLEVEVAAQWFAAGLCRQSCSQQQHETRADVQAQHR